MAAPHVNVADNRYGKHQTSIETCLIAAEDVTSGAVNGRGRGLIHLWVGPFTGTSVSILHAPVQTDTEPDEAEFIPLEDVDGLVVIELPATAATAPVCVPVNVQRVHTLFWYKLVSDAAMPGGEVEDRTLRSTLRYFS